MIGIDTFDLQDELYDLFSTDSELISYLKLEATPLEESLQNKIRRTKVDETVLETDTTDILPFFSYSFIAGMSRTSNYLVNKSPMQINIYYNYDADIRPIYKKIKKLLNENYDDMRVISEGQYTSASFQSIRCYRFIVSPLVNS